jgi:hypothetical protein
VGQLVFTEYDCSLGVLPARSAACRFRSLPLSLPPFAALLPPFCRSFRRLRLASSGEPKRVNQAVAERLWLTK